MSDNSKESTSIVADVRKSLDTIHHYIDTHPRTIKYSVYSIGTVGLVVLLRSVHVGKFIKHSSEIPKRFITKGIHLQGTVKEIHSDGLIYVQHIPILNLRLPWQQSERRELLPMNLAFVDLTSDGSKDWLKNNLLQKHVWFQVLKVEKEHDMSLQSAVFKQKFLFWKTCINEQVIEQGLCKVLTVPEQDLKSLTVKQSELLNRMIGLEKKADKKHRGIWKEEKPPFKQTVKKIIYTPVVIVKYLYEKSKNMLKKSKTT